MTASEKINSFKDFPAGWRFGNGIKFKDAAIQKAQEINTNFISKGFKTDAFPAEDGAIMVSADSDKVYFEVIVDANGGIESLQSSDQPERKSEIPENFWQLL